MSTNDNFDSKKIMEDIDSLENEPKKKKVSLKIKFLNFIETLIFVVLMGVVVIVVLYSCLESMLGGFDTDYSYTDTSYSNYDDYTYNDYSNYKNINISTNTNTNTNTNLNVNITLEEFLKTDIGNKILTNTIQTNSITNETTTEDNISSEEIESTEETGYKSDEVVKQEIDEQRKNLIIKEEGKNVNDDLIISIENKNVDLVFDLFVYAVFYKDDKIVSIDEQETSVILKDSKKYLKIEETPKEYDRYDVFVTKFDIMNFGDSILNEYITLIPYTEKGNIKVKINNTSNKKINRAELTIIYYDSRGNILDIEESTEYNIWKSLSGETIGYGVWDDSKSEYIDHSDYEVILDAAIHYE